MEVLATGKPGISKHLDPTWESFPQENLPIQDRSESSYGFYSRAVFANEPSATPKAITDHYRSALGHKGRKAGTT